MISIIVPVYNAEKYLNRCIQSILLQSYKEFEVLIIDDGSTDNSALLADDLEKNNNCIQTIHKENGGSASARNLGLQNAKGEYIVFIDADDYIHPQYLELLVTKAECLEADIVQCNYLISYSDYVEYDFQCFKDELEYTNIQFLERFCEKATYLKTAVLWNKIYKKELFSNLEFPINKGIDDEFLICKVIYRARKIIEIDNVLYYYFMSENSQMRSKPTLKSIDNVEAIEGQLEFFKSIGQPRLYNMLLYRYYSSVAGAHYLVKESFPNEEEILIQLEQKKRGWTKALRIKETPFIDKCSLIIRMTCPIFFSILHRKVKR